MPYPTTSSATDIWSLRDQYKAKAGGNWPTELPSLIQTNLEVNLDAASYSGTGTTWFDQSVNNNDATLINSPSYSTSEGGYFTFTGSSQAASLGTGSIYGTGAMSVEVWCYPTANTDSIVTRGASRTNVTTRELDLFGNGSLLIFYLTNLSSGNGVVCTYPSLNAWHHIVATFDGTTAASGMRIYIDGSLATADNAVSVITNPTESLDLRIGGSSGPYDFEGRISSTNFYSKALSLSEVQNNFNFLRGRYGL